MPYVTQWIEPDVKVTFPDGNAVYVAYGDNDFDNPLEFWFTLRNDDASDDENPPIDIRDWSGYNPKISVQNNILAAYQLEDLYYDEQRDVWYCSWVPGEW